ncbi:MAG: DoxX family protein [Longimicrobiales bacterium]
MVFPELAAYTALALLVFRSVLALVFLSSGWAHANHPKERGESIGMAPAATRVLGIVQVVAAVAMVVGVYAQVTAAVLAVIMLGAIRKKIFVWKKGFWGDGGGDGWWYELLYITGLLVIMTTGGGEWVLL